VVPHRREQYPARRTVAARPASNYHRRVRTRSIGPFTVTAVGSGNVCLPISGGRGLRASDVEHALHETIAFGVTLIDVAAHADSEKLVGQVVRDQRARDRVVVATHVPLLDARPGPPRDLMRERLPVPYLEHRVEAALLATRLDALPLVQLPLRPAWLASPAWPDLVGSCARLVAEGKVLTWAAWLDDLGDLGDLGDLESVANHRDRGDRANPGPAADRPEPPEAERRERPASLARATRDAHRGSADRTAPGARLEPGERTTPGGLIVLADLTALEPYEDAARLAGSPARTTAADQPGSASAGSATVAALLAEPWLAAVAVTYQLCDRRAEPLLAMAAAYKLPVLAHHPLAGGALAGTLAPGVRLPPRDDRNALGTAELERIAVGVARLTGLVKRAPPAATASAASRQAAEHAARTRPEHVHCGDVAELALRFAIDGAGIALPRLHRSDHLLPAIAAAAAPPLPADLLAEIDQIFPPSR
jgi:aryl-alcohol dehydrogenase-like predicted oxidoreductase